jgi:two-component system KDP operon response regulator KdpE
MQPRCPPDPDRRRRGPIRRFVRLALEAEGTGARGRALQRGLIEAGTRKPDLLVLDLGLPDGDGVA